MNRIINKAVALLVPATLNPEKLAASCHFRHLRLKEDRARFEHFQAIHTLSCSVQNNLMLVTGLLT